MRKDKRLAAAQSQLPEAMIQHIQSFLNAKEAAQTTLVSKSWHNAWLTRPNLDFDQDDFKKETDKDNERSASRFWKFVNKVVQRYAIFNLKIHSLRLWVHGSADAKYCSYVNELIVKAMKMGAAALDFKFHRHNWEFALPNEVFGAENLITLSVSGCKICIGADGEVHCSRLKSLTLDWVSVKLGYVMWKLISSCPLIENLSVSRIYEFGIADLGSVVDEFHNLKCLTLDSCYSYSVIEISSPSIECINLHKMFSANFDVPNLRKFTCSGSYIPKLSFEATTNTWESHISIECKGTPPASWFLKLNKLLKALRQSKVSLSLEISSEKKIDCAGEIPGLTKPEVENLAINGLCSVDPALFYCLFQCCRPIYIRQHWFHTSHGAGKFKLITNDFNDFVYKRMMHQVCLNSCFAYQRTSALCNIEEISVEFYDESISSWRPQQLDTSMSLRANEQRIRLHLRWGH